MKLWSMMGSLGFLLVAVNAWATNYVGIGTTAPAAPLHIGGIQTGADAVYRGNLIVETLETDAGPNGLEFKSGNTGSGYGHRLASIYDGASNVNLQFESRQNSANWSTVMTLAGATGNVGIGTTSPLKNVTTRKALILADTTNNAGIEVWGASSGKLDLESVAGNSYIGNLTPASGNTYILTGAGTTAMTLLGSNGYVGIGTGAPSQLLEVNGNMKMDGTTLYTAGSSSTYGALTIDGSKNGYSGINFKISGTNQKTLMMTIPYEGVFNQSDAAWDWYYTNNTLTYSSDRRLKKEIHPIEGALDKVLKLEGVFYKWIDPVRQGNSLARMGFIAQDVEPWFPEAVELAPEGTTKLPGGTKMLAYDALIAPVVQALKEFHQKWVLDHATLEGIVGQVKSSEKSVQSLEARVAKLVVENEEIRQENRLLRDYLCEKDRSAKICE